MTDRPSARHVMYIQPNSEVGGSDIALARTIEAMSTSGQRSTVVLPNDGPLVGRLRAAGAEVLFLPMQQLRTLPSVTYQARYILKFVPTVMRLTSMVRQAAPDIVHSNSAYCLYGAFAAKFAGRPHVWHIREMAPSLPLLTRLYAAMVSGLSTTILAMSDACVDALYRTPPAHTVVMPDALDGDAFRSALHPGRLRAELGIGENTPIIGFAARLDPWKGGHVFIDACEMLAARHPQCRFIIAGGAPQGLEAYEKQLKSRVAAAGLNDKVLFLGWRYRLADMADVMDGFDIFCHTSVTPEPFGLVLLEAMAVGTPVISVRAGGPLTIIEDGVSGILTPPGDAAALADAISSLIEDPQRAARLGAAGKARQKMEFSPPQFIERLSRVYRETLARHSSRRDSGIQA